MPDLEEKIMFIVDGVLNRLHKFNETIGDITSRYTFKKSFFNPLQEETSLIN